MIFNNILDEGDAAIHWKIQKQFQLKTKNKPKVFDSRPITLTDISYKLMMSILKDKTELHLNNA